jgi:hypothetical protein
MPQLPRLFPWFVPELKYEGFRALAVLRNYNSELNCSRPQTPRLNRLEAVSSLSARSMSLNAGGVRFLECRHYDLARHARGSWSRLRV